MNRRIEDKVRSLAAEVVAAKDDQEQTRKVHQLRGSLRQYMEQLRVRLSAYPFARERRVLNDVPPHDTGPENAGEPTRPTNTVEITNATSTIQTKPNGKDKDTTKAS
jgi:hypothetical protein